MQFVGQTCRKCKNDLENTIVEAQSLKISGVLYYPYISKSRCDSERSRIAVRFWCIASLGNFRLIPYMSVENMFY